MNITDMQFTFINRNTNFANTNEYDLFLNGSKRLMTKDETPFTIGYNEFISSFFDTKRYTIFVAIDKTDYKQYHVASEEAAKNACIKEYVTITNA